MVQRFQVTYGRITGSYDRGNYILHIIIILFLLAGLETVSGQKFLTPDSLSFGMYGRTGIDFAPVKGAAPGRSLNLTGMGSLGGRLEEGDYLEFMTRYNIPLKDTSAKGPSVFIQTRLSMFSRSNTFVGFYSTGSLDDLVILLPEAFVEARDLFVPGFSAWVGAKFYRGDDIHIADYYYFNDLDGQGAGLQYKNTEVAAIVITSPDSSFNVPPYVYNNLVDGTIRNTLRQRTVFVIQHRFNIGGKHRFHLLGEYHKLSEAEQSQTDSVIHPSDHGFVGGIKYTTQLQKKYKQSVINLSARYGNRIANGGSGSNSRTYLTYGAFDHDVQNFNGAYSFNTANEIIMQASPRLFLQAYFVGIWSKGASGSKNKGKNLNGEEVFNRKNLLAFGSRSSWFINDYLLLINELSYSARKDGTQPYAETVKFSIAPTFSPTGKLGVFVRPHIRFVYAISWYDVFARENTYSPYLQSAGKHKFGHYIGIKSEWWF